MIELKNTNPNGKIVLVSILNFVKLLSETCENWVQKLIEYVIFSRGCCGCPQNKKIHNFHITNLIKWNELKLSM